ncbi:RNA-binding protein 12B isoform X1 [Coregonus clupeaformis]|uniref:RNA-binding protein 12B isoform X1 n=2 Tax=Coregonus clupeaformis TaxID=59861 RepID=UPI001E1C7DA8|nr:RNA-binding protein 12B isoform X1 [Coregonus clupeaformis]
MTIILRLQGLNIEAGTEDIRRFFTNLYIPEGGVYIIGGHLGEAFIVFTTERDGQHAMRRSGTILRGSPVTLHISSIAELQRKMESKLQREKLLPLLLPEKKPLPPPEALLPDPATALLIGLVAAIQGLQSNQPGEHNNAAAAPGPVLRVDSTAVPVGEPRRPEEAYSPRPGYVRLFGLPKTVTRQEICHFFKGLLVQDVIANVKLGVSHGCLVKFGHAQDACDALSFNHQRLGRISVEVRGASEELWRYAIQQCQNPSYDPLENPLYRPTTQKDRTSYKSQEIPSYTIQRDGPSLESEEMQHQTQERARPSYRTQRQSLYEPDRETPMTWAKRLSEDRSLSRSPKRPRSCESLSSSVEYCIMAQNLSKTITKTEIKELFGCPNIANSKILHLLYKDSQRTDTAFVVFDQTEDYIYALNLNGCHVGSQAIDVSSVSKEKMQAMLSTGRHHGNPKTTPAVSERSEEEKHQIERPRVSQFPTGQTCVYIRNLQSDVTKMEIRDFFCELPLAEQFIYMLHDQEGNGIGEAVAQFKTEDFATRAQKQHGKTYMGTRVLLTCISFQQMEDILKRNP